MNKESLKERILECLKSGSKKDNDLYNEAFGLYRESENKDQNQERQYNLGFTDWNLKNLLYDLQKINGITDLEVAKASMEIVKDVNEIEVTNPEIVGKETTGTEPVPANTEPITASTEPAADSEIEVKGEIDVSNGEAEIADTDENTDKSDVKEETDEVKALDPDEFAKAATSEERAILRDDYPFLSDKNCPDELKVLVADKITAFQTYIEAHAKLVKHSNGELALTEEELKQVTKDSVENFEANREIFKELDYYKIHGKILGEHPIFRELTLQREVDAMSNKECVNYLNSSKKFISVKTKELETLVTAKGKGYKEKMVSLNAEISARQEKLALVKIKLEINE